MPDKIFGYTWKRFVAIANAGSPEAVPINESVTISPVLCSSFCTSSGILAANALFTNFFVVTCCGFVKYLLRFHFQHTAHVPLQQLGHKYAG